MNRIAVIDFETTGLSPTQGARATEVAAVILSDGQIIGRYQSLMNSGGYIPAEITRLTGITNKMVASAPPAKQVIRELHDFVQDSVLVAHNASFDRKFLINEGLLAGLSFKDNFLCTLLLSRRLFPTAVNHKLGTLANHVGLRVEGSFHRALFDAEITAQLFVKLVDKIKTRRSIDQVTFDFLYKLQKSKIQRNY